MERFWETTKQHPWLIGGAVLVGALLIWWWASGSSSSSSGSTAGLYVESQDPNVIAANAAEQVSENQTTAAVSLGQQQADVQTAYINAAASVANNQTTALTSLASTSANLQAQLAAGQNATNITLAGLGLQSQEVSAVANQTLADSAVAAAGQQEYYNAATNNANDYYGAINNTINNNPGFYVPLLSVGGTITNEGGGNAGTGTANIAAPAFATNLASLLSSITATHLPVVSQSFNTNTGNTTTVNSA